MFWLAKSLQAIDNLYLASASSDAVFRQNTRMRDETIPVFDTLFDRWHAVDGHTEGIEAFTYGCMEVGIQNVMPFRV